MINHKNGKSMRKTTYLHRLLALMMCLGLMLPMFSGLIAFSALNTGQEEIRSRLLHQIMEEGWDPYSASMSVEEFYVLMDMFEDGTLPISSNNNSNNSGKSIYSALARSVLSVLGLADDEDAAENSVAIPRTMFLLGGLADESGFDDYDNDNGSEGNIYPPGLDKYNAGYKLPPANWNGIGVTTDNNTGALRAAVIVDGINDADPHTAGDVNQALFPKIDGYYVRSVSAAGGSVSILGVIDKGNNDYVYYYMSTDDQSTLVSSTTLQDGAKFIVNYSLNEHAISYKIEMSDGSNVPADITLDSVFGEMRPTKTVDAAYSFDVIAPYGYTAQVFRVAGSNRTEITGTDTINNGYPLGTEPVYKMESKKLVPDTDKGPMNMTRNAIFYNDSVSEDRTIVAVLTKREAPVFNAYRLLPNTDNTGGRGTSSFYKVKAIDRETGEEIEVLYDYEDVFEWANDRPSKYDYVESSITLGGATKGNVKDGNVATADKWGWNANVDVTNNAKMDYDEETNSYSYQWTFQTNSGSGGFTLDTLEINGVAVRIPYLPKQTNGNNETTGAEGGIRTWFTVGTLPDGAAVRVEFLMSFNSSPQQRVYRISVTGAHSNVTLTNMNLIMGTGAPETSVYNLEGIHADTGNTTSQLPAIEYYSVQNDNVPANQWIKGNLGDVLVRQPNYTGDENNHGANIRFKLADGYGEPFYLFESYLGNVINEQASAERMADGVTFDNAQKVQPLPDDADVPLSSQYIYGPDAEGWYYIRLTTQEDKINKFALLTIVAKPVKYVVRYIPGVLSANEDKGLEERSPGNMPMFDHSNSDPSFSESPNGWQYDDNNGFYYDTVTNNKISITTTVPNDPKSWYKFVDWVIVDENGEPVQVPPEMQAVSLYSDDPEGEGGEEGEAAKDYSIHISSNRALNVTDVNEYSIENDGLGGNAVSVRVIRLMPTWRPVINPFKYSVVVDWVDSMGELHQEHFKGYWDEILTDTPDTADLTVFVNKDAEPLQRWLKEHPTYNFWDEVNNAVDDTGYDPNTPNSGKKSAKDKIEDSMNELYPELARRLDSAEAGSLYNTVLKSLLDRDISGGLNNDSPDGTDDFSRLGGYAFSVHQNGGKIVIWMCEKKSGLEIRNDMQGGAFSEGEEFYYTINAVSGGLPLEGIYKAYPEGFVGGEDGKTRMILDEDGNERVLMDTDAWLVKFEDGKIANMVKNAPVPIDPDDPDTEYAAPEFPADPVTYFTFEVSKDARVNKGIILYAPVGDYTVTEAGSKSGGAYKVKLDYYDWTTNKEPEQYPFRLVDIQAPEGEQWVWGKKTEHIPETDNTLSQVSVGIEYKEGSHNRLYVIQFTNQTSSLTVGNEIDGSNDTSIFFSYEVKLKLSDKITPLKKDIEGYYYFNYTTYYLGTDDEIDGKGEIQLSPIDNDPDGFNWIGRVNVANHRQLKIITSVPVQPDSDEPETIKAFAKIFALLDGDSEQTVPANYSVHELEIPEMYSLEKIKTNNSSIVTSKADSIASGMLPAVEDHSVTFNHIYGIRLPDTGYNGIMSYWTFGALLIAAVAVIIIYEARRKA